MNVKEVKQLYDNLAKQVANLSLQVTNHCGQHTWDKVLNGMYFLSVIIMFCFLKWGK